eukprot:Hpha_TRINITY_DN16059_c3_g6::TRINITY_DN16059_c3_g6_i1::g.117218::m.117218
MRSSRRVQQMHPLLSSTIFSSVLFSPVIRLASIWISLMSLTITAQRSPCRLSSSRFISVVFPVPKNPESTVTGRGSMKRSHTPFTPSRSSTAPGITSLASTVMAVSRTLMVSVRLVSTPFFLQIQRRADRNSASPSRDTPTFFSTSYPITKRPGSSPSALSVSHMILFIGGRGCPPISYWTWPSQAGTKTTSRVSCPYGCIVADCPSLGDSVRSARTAAGASLGQESLVLPTCVTTSCTCGSRLAFEPQSRTRKVLFSMSTLVSPFSSTGTWTSVTLRDFNPIFTLTLFSCAPLRAKKYRN